MVRSHWGGHSGLLNRRPTDAFRQTCADPGEAQQLSLVCVTRFYDRYVRDLMLRFGLHILDIHLQEHLETEHENRANVHLGTGRT